jgi:hypothetical protein
MAKKCWHEGSCSDFLAIHKRAITRRYCIAGESGGFHVWKAEEKDISPISPWYDGQGIFGCRLTCFESLRRGWVLVGTSARLNYPALRTVANIVASYLLSSLARGEDPKRQSASIKKTFFLRRLSF